MQERLQWMPPGVVRKTYKAAQKENRGGRLSEGFVPGLNSGDHSRSIRSVANILPERAGKVAGKDELNTPRERAVRHSLYADDAAETLDNTEKIVYDSGASSGAYHDSNDPDGAKRDAHAELYYASLRMVNMMLTYRLIYESESTVEYEYYPEGNEKEKGLVSLSKSDGKVSIIDLPQVDDTKIYARMLFKRLRAFHANNTYKASGKVAWY